MAKNVVLQPNFLYSIGIMSQKCNHKGQIKEKELSGEEMAGVCVKCLMPVPLDSSNFVEKLCDSWVQTRGYEACVFCMPIPLRVC